MRGITDGAERQDYCQSCLGIPERVRQQGGSRVGSTELCGGIRAEA